MIRAGALEAVLAIIRSRKPIMDGLDYGMATIGERAEMRAKSRTLDDLASAVCALKDESNG